MIDTQLLLDVILAVAALVAATAALSAVMLIAPSAGRPGLLPHGGIRRDLRPEPQPQPDLEDVRELVLH